MKASLASALLDDPDVGLPRDHGGGADHLDVHEAALLEPDSAAELARLRTRHFVTGAVRSWAGDDGSVVQVTLHRFASSADAAAAVADLESALVGAAGEPRPFAGGVLLRLPADPHAGVAHVALMTGADVAVMVVTAASTGGPDSDGALAQALAVRQQARLVGR